MIFSLEPPESFDFPSSLEHADAAASAADSTIAKAPTRPRCMLTLMTDPSQVVSISGGFYLTPR
ncbi:hypothetical protein GCM10023195_59400 [Actinoallomurus liliacearum]|uniref:Uncharacterized protein n=1 Tax=Actinoallomurus liliacearum TaxID=1080073 RepID=A0ABP8TTK8_9ACTN